MSMPIIPINSFMLFDPHFFLLQQKTFLVAFINDKFTAKQCIFEQICIK